MCAARVVELEAANATLEETAAQSASKAKTDMENALAEAAATAAAKLSAAESGMFLVDAE